MRVVIAAMLLSAIMLMAGCAQNMGGEKKADAQNDGAGGPKADAGAMNSAGTGRNSDAGAQKISVDFLYYRNCSYCVQMKPHVESAAGKFGGRVEIRLLDAELRGMDADVTEAYQRYKMEGKFGGFPTLVADDNATLVGLRGEDEIFRWMCMRFKVLPEACG